MHTVSKRSGSAELAPMSLWQSLGFFDVLWLLFAESIYLLLPALDHAGVPVFVNFLISLGLPVGLLMLGAGLAYQREGLRWEWEAFKGRFRLQRMKRSAWLWSLALAVIIFLGPGLLSSSAAWLQQITPMPAALQKIFNVTPSTLMGIPLAGARGVFAG